MRTRRLETKDDILRTTVKDASVLQTGPHSVLLATQAIVKARKQISSADSAMLNQRKLSAVGESTPGRLRIEAVADDVLRVRYAEGDSLPENRTPMMAGDFRRPGIAG